MSGPERLTEDQEQVLAFVIPYHRDNGCLPSAPETAQACGFRSPRPVVKILRELEAMGIIERDAAHARLGAVALDSAPPMMSWDQQHWIATRERAEQLALLRSLHAAFEWAPSLDAIGALHREGAARLVLIEAYDSLIERLRPLHPASERAQTDLVELEALIRDCLAKATDWTTFCAIRLVWMGSAQESMAWLRPLQSGYVGAVKVAQRRRNEPMIAFYASAVPAEQLHDPRLRRLLDELADGLTRLREVDSRHTVKPSRYRTADSDRLLAVTTGP